MSSRWRVNIRRADGSICRHPSDAECQRCEEDRQGALRAPGLAKPWAYSFHMSAADLEDRVFGPGETPHDISSRRELLEFCEARGLDSRYLKESIVFPHRKPREI